MYRLKEHEKKILHKYLHTETYDYSIVNVENNGVYTIAEVQEFTNDGKSIESEYSLYFKNGKLENVNGDLLCEIYGTYAADTDITFVMMDICHGNEIDSTEVIGFTYGNETKNMNVLYEQIGKFKAEFS